MKPAGALLTLALASFSECPDLPGPAFTSAAEEHWLRLDATADTAEFLSIHRNLSPGEGDALGHLRQLHLVVDGRRIFPPGGGWLTWDLDEPLDPETLADADVHERALMDLAPSVSVEAAGLALDEAGAVCLWRHVRIERAAEWLRFIESGVLRGPGPHFPVGEFPAFDARSSELLEAAWARGERFWSIDGDSLRIDMPSTGENAARIFAHAFAAALAGEPWDFEPWSHLGACMRDVDISGERLRVRLGPDESGWMRVLRGEEPAQADAPLPYDVATLRAAGFEVEAALAGRLPVPVR